MSRYQDDELGFVGAVASAVPMALKGVKKIGKIFKKKKKKKKGKVTKVEPTTIIGDTGAGSSASEKATKDAAIDVLKEAAASAPSGATPAEIAKAVVASIPGPVRDIVLEALRAQSASGAEQEQTMQALTGQIDESLKPHITAMLASLQSAQLQNQATYEHQSLVNKAKFEDSTTSGLQSALTKLDAIERRLSGSAVVPRDRVSIFGGRSVLEGK